MRRAMIVEDDAEVAFLLGETLRRWDFEPMVFMEGKPAVSWAKEHHPDLILLDLMLPDIDGYHICRDLKLDRETNLIPILMVTARDQPADRVHGLEVGANDYLTKPFTEAQLREAVHKVLAWREDLERRGAEGEIHFQFPSDTRHLEDLNRLLGSLFLYTGLPPFQINQLKLVVAELGTNAIEWGHRNQVDRIVTVTYRIDPGKITIIIRDTGPGFNPSNLPHAAKPEDPISHMEVREQLGLRDGGFGIMLARGLVDDLQYNERGNEVRLVKYVPTACLGTPPP